MAAVYCNGTTACEGPARELIKQVFPSNNADAVTLLRSPLLVAGLPCTGANGGANVRLEKGHRSFEETYALVLTTVAANETIVIRINTAEAVCTVAYIGWKT